MVISEKSEEQLLSMIPTSAYKWTLLDRVRNKKSNFVAIYKHDDNNVWCVLKSSNYSDSIHATLFSDKQIPDYIETDMECLLNFISSISCKPTTFIMKPMKKGGVSEAYRHTDKITKDY